MVAMKDRKHLTALEVERLITAPPRQPHRATRPLPDPLDVPPRTAGIRDLRTEVAPGRSREPGAARDPAEEG